MKFLKATLFDGSYHDVDSSEMAFKIGRSLSVAISEYAPDSEVIVDKEKYTSRYIILPKDSKLEEVYYYRCVNGECAKMHVSRISKTDYKCELCGSKTLERTFIVPSLGFIAPNFEPLSRHQKPKKTYGSNISYLGPLSMNEADLVLGNIIVQKSEEDKMLIVNENPFFFCEICGYAELRQNHHNIHFITSEHKDHRGKVCKNQNLKRINLGYEIITDVIKLKINDEMDYKTAISTLAAINNGIISYLQIDRHDVNSVLQRTPDNKYAFIFYDTTFGGSGNVKSLMTCEGMKKVFETAYLSVKEDCCDIDSSCTSCLRNYQNRAFHKDLIRGLAKAMIYKLKNEV
ncbi:MAG TPA: hypothetical protein GX708_18930 [Gallicola sp.]|nr:hypothetical protein [Gallicola sp.]